MLTQNIQKSSSDIIDVFIEFATRELQSPIPQKDSFAEFTNRTCLASTLYEYTRNHTIQTFGMKYTSIW